MMYVRDDLERKHADWYEEAAKKADELDIPIKSPHRIVSPQIHQDNYTASTVSDYYRYSVRLLSLFCPITIVILSDYYRYSVRLLSLFCPITIVILSDYYRYSVRLQSLFCPITIVILSDYYRYSVRLLSLFCPINIVILYLQIFWILSPMICLLDFLLSIKFIRMVIYWCHLLLPTIVIGKKALNHL